jgi:hypothetical protein
MAPFDDNDGFGDDSIEEVNWDDADSAYSDDSEKGSGETDVPEDDYLVRVGSLELKRSSKGNYMLNGQVAVLRSLTKEGDEATAYAGMPIWTFFMLQGKPFSLRLTRQLEEAIGVNGGGVRELIAAAQESTVRVTTRIERQKGYPPALKLASISPATEDDLQFAIASATDAPPF